MLRIKPILIGIIIINIMSFTFLPVNASEGVTFLVLEKQYEVKAGDQVTWRWTNTTSLENDELMHEMTIENGSTVQFPITLGTKQSCTITNVTGSSAKQEVYGTFSFDNNLTSTEMIIARDYVRKTLDNRSYWGMLEATNESYEMDGEFVNWVETLDEFTYKKYQMHWPTGWITYYSFTSLDANDNVLSFHERELLNPEHLLKYKATPGFKVIILSLALGVLALIAKKNVN